MYNRILRPVYIFIFEMVLGWKIVGKKPDHKKFIIIAAPHTSNWDFMVGEWARASLRMKSWYVAKKELFIWPFGYLFRLLGGFPVDRKKNSNLVEQIVAIYDHRDEFNITIAPEGTRSYNPDWKSGFYNIAMLAKIPIQMAAFDYPSRTVTFAEPFFPKGDFKEDLIFIKSFFKDFRGKNPENGVRLD
ncbi:MAG: 1-acyl-sn-glycerol-3-phosphate acyltransferase [Flavobacteriales bacterium]|nr:1-acyl-sn-glycerol-3-phosphate acyltransferase [Flavobacteriales bacterium]